jgi:hypothetical protein
MNDFPAGDSPEASRLLKGKEALEVNLIFSKPTEGVKHEQRREQSFCGNMVGRMAGNTP